MERGEIVPSTEKKGEYFEAELVTYYNYIVLGLDIIWEAADAGNPEAARLLKEMVEKVVTDAGALDRGNSFGQDPEEQDDEKRI